MPRWRRWRLREALAFDPGPRGPRRLLRLLARPVRTARGRRGVVLQPYRGYGSPERIFVIGRVFWQHTGGSIEAAEFRAIVRRIRRRPVRGARVRARFYGAEHEVETDRDGYFRVEMAPGTPVPRDRVWHRLDLSAARAGTRPRPGRRLHPARPTARTVVVSDIDDTVMFTGVANKAAMLLAAVRRRMPRAAPSFPAFRLLYRALHAGASGDECNPMLYVSRAPWGIYDMLEAFFHRHDIPAGRSSSCASGGSAGAGRCRGGRPTTSSVLIEAMMRLYSDMPFVLIGDSGQHDPEIYRRIVEGIPGRVKAVYIRDVAARGPERAAEVAAMAAALQASRRPPGACRRQPGDRRGRRAARADLGRSRSPASRPASRSGLLGEARQTAAGR